MYQILVEARNAAVEGNWDHYEELEKEWHKKFREMIPSFPNLDPVVDELFGEDEEISMILYMEPSDPGEDPCEKDIILVERLNPSYSGEDLSNNDDLHSYFHQHPCFAIVDDPSGEQRAAPLAGRFVDLSGSLVLGTGSDEVTAGLSGFLGVADVNGTDGSSDANLVEGELSINVGGALATLTIVQDPMNKIDLDPSGIGTITVLFAVRHPDFAWDALLPDLQRLRLPIASDGDSGYVIDIPPTSVRNLFPVVPSPLSDFNGDGTLDLATDLQAFVAEHQAHRDRTDVNVDGAWTQEDVDMWLDRFNRDASN